jgi:hypothetical protein
MWILIIFLHFTGDTSYTTVQIPRFHTHYQCWTAGMVVENRFINMEQQPPAWECIEVPKATNDGGE